MQTKTQTNIIRDAKFYRVAEEKFDCLESAREAASAMGGAVVDLNSLVPTRPIYVVRLPPRPASPHGSYTTVVGCNGTRFVDWSTHLCG